MSDKVKISLIIIFTLLVLCGVFSLFFALNTYMNNNCEKYVNAHTGTTAADLDYIKDSNFDFFILEGDISAIDPQINNEIKGEYLKIKIYTKRYTRHTRQVAQHVGNTTTYRTEVYHTWDTINVSETSATSFDFLGDTFQVRDFQINNYKEILEIKDSRDKNIKYVYYGIPAKIHGCITGTYNNYELTNQELYMGQTINDVIEYQKTEKILFIFLYWFIGLALFGCLIAFEYCYIKNELL